jgi:hypothetical protein
MNDRTKAAIAGGALAGILSVIPLVGSCCFLWALAGGVLAVFMYMRSSSAAPLEIADGAKLGLMAGGVGAVIYLIIALPMMLLSGGAAISQQLQRQGSEGGAALGAGMLAGLGAFVVVIVAIVIVGCGALGGLIGAAIFGKKGAGGAGPMPPPPTGGYTGGMTGGMPPQPPPPPVGEPPTGFGTGS